MFADHTAADLPSMRREIFAVMTPFHNDMPANIGRRHGMDSATTAWRRGIDSRRHGFNRRWIIDDAPLASLYALFAIHPATFSAHRLARTQCLR